MTERQIKIFYLVKRFRYTHKDDKAALDALWHILWHSYPIVYSYEDLAKISKAADARKAKKKRANKYLRSMADSYDELHFLTLTWTDEYLTKLNERTRHRYVARYLDKCCKDYFANQDYGTKTQREHYHAVVAFDFDAFEKWPYGFMKLKQIGKKDDKTTRGRLSTYMLKLTNHAGKLGTGKSFHKRGLKEVDILPF